MNGKIILAIACFTLSIGARAQELNVWLNGGWQGLTYRVQNGQKSLLPGGSLGLGYTFPLGAHLGLITGISGGFYGDRATLHDGMYVYNQVDNVGSAFEYNVKTTNYTETQRFFSFDVPLMLQYHTTGTRTQWYFNGGGKLLLPLSISVKASAKQLDLAAYYPDFNTVLSNLPQHGLGTINNWQASTTYNLRTGAALSAETGLRFMLSAHTSLYTGIYFDYGLTNIRDNNDASPLVSYSPNGLSGVQAGSILRLQNTGDAKLLCFGIQVKLGFSHGKSKAEATPQPQAPSAQPAKRTVLVQTQPAPERPRPVQPEKQPEPLPAVLQHVQPALTRDELQLLEPPITFGVFRKTDLPEKLKPRLDKIADLLNKYPAIRIAVVGYTCSIGTQAENLRVGLARARAVAEYLQSKGVDAGRMDVSSEGESNPAVPNNSPANRSQNRRVVVLYRPVE